MKYQVLTASLLLALAGCDQRSQPAEVATIQPTETTPSTTPEPVNQPCTESSGYQVMPAGLTLSIPYHVRADIIQKDESGQSRRHVVLEYLDGNLETTLDALEQSLAADAFAPRPKRETADGRVIVPFLKNGYQNIIVVLDASPGDTPRNPDAKGTVTLQYVMEDTFTAPAPADAE